MWAKIAAKPMHQLAKPKMVTPKSLRAMQLANPHNVAMIIDMQNVVKKHLPIPPILDIIGEYLENYFNPAKYNYNNKPEVNGCSGEYVRSGKNFYTTFNLQSKYTNPRYTITYAFFRVFNRNAEKYYNKDMMKCEIIFYSNPSKNYSDWNYKIEYIFPANELDDKYINALTTYEKFCVNLYRIFIDSNKCFNHHYFNNNRHIDHKCKELWHIWKIEMKPAIQYFNNRRKILFANEHVIPYLWKP